MTDNIFIPVEGAINLRDFGGHTTTDGRNVKTGLLFRCGLMTEIEEHAYDAFAELDIGVICDLRSEDEAIDHPTPDHPAFAGRVHIPIWPGSSDQFQQTIRDQAPVKEDFINFMKDITREIVRDHPHAYKQLMEELLGTDRGFLLHCSAGKDRTGVGAAIILLTLGCDEETIVNDYMTSNKSKALAERAKKRMMERMKESGFPGEPDESVLHVLSGVREEYLHGAIQEMHDTFGGIDGYLEEIGISQAEKAALQGRLLV